MTISRNTPIVSSITYMLVALLVVVILALTDTHKAMSTPMMSGNGTNIFRAIASR
jgi:hypothetical protein